MKLPPHSPIDWQSITTTQDGWRNFCAFVGGKVMVMATSGVRDDGLPIAEAVNRAIERVAKELEADGAPAGFADDFRRQYRADRPNQMQLVAASVKNWQELEEAATARKGRRKSALRGVGGAP